MTLRASNGATATGVTDAEGAVVIDIVNVSTEVDYGEEGKRKRFGGEVTMEAGDGYRVFSAGCLRVDGGSGIEMPVRRLEDPNDPYFERIGLDGRDVLYAENEFFSVRTNAETHAVSGILHAPGASRMTMRPNVRDGSAVTDTLEEKTFDVVDGRGVFLFRETA